MGPYLFTILFFIFSSTAWSSSLPAETELNLPLSEKNYLQLYREFQKYSPEKKNREDFYFEIYRQQQYLLNTASPPTKLRLMKNPKGSIKLQVQKQLKKLLVPPFTIKQTSSAEYKTKIPEDFFVLLKSYYDDLENQDLYALEEARSIEEFLTNQGLIALAGQSCELCSTKGPYFLSHYNQKERLSLEIKIEGELFALNLGRTYNNDEWSFELEAELNDQSHPEKSAKKLRQWLLNTGWNDSDVPAVKKDPMVRSLTFLNRLYSFALSNP